MLKFFLWHDCATIFVTIQGVELHFQFFMESSIIVDGKDVFNLIIPGPVSIAGG
jgi:hypothetical protein